MCLPRIVSDPALPDGVVEFRSSVDGRRLGAVVGLAKGRSTFSAKQTTCERGHRHRSKVEARVCARVYADAEQDGMTAYRDARLPLWALPPTDAGIPFYITIDFVVKDVSGRIARLVDAKSGRRSREWARGRAAAEATYGIKVEETDGKESA